MKDALDLRDTQLSEQRQCERGVSLTTRQAGLRTEVWSRRNTMSTFWVNFLTPPHGAISNSRGVADASDMEVILHPAARDQPGGRRNTKLDAKSASMNSKRLKNNPIANEAQLIGLGASGRKDFDTVSAALRTIVESDT
jgi:hypothetical protein